MRKIWTYVAASMIGASEQASSRICAWSQACFGLALVKHVMWLPVPDDNGSEMSFHGVAGCITSSPTFRSLRKCTMSRNWLEDHQCDIPFVSGAILPASSQPVLSNYGSQQPGCHFEMNSLMSVSLCHGSRAKYWRHCFPAGTANENELVNIILPLAKIYQSVHEKSGGNFCVPIALPLRLIYQVPT